MPNTVHSRQLKMYASFSKSSSQSSLQLREFEFKQSDQSDSSGLSIASCAFQRRFLSRLDSLSRCLTRRDNPLQSDENDFK